MGVPINYEKDRIKRIAIEMDGGLQKWAPIQRRRLVQRQHRKMKVPAKLTVTPTTIPDIQELLVGGIEHYVKHGDFTRLNKIVLALPATNNRDAAIAYIKIFTDLTWDRRKLSFRKNRDWNLDPQLYDKAKDHQWTEYKTKRESKRTVSGNQLDPDHFLSKVLEEIQNNTDRFSSYDIELFIKQVAEIKEYQDE
jgi:hypothetical protein